jgi:hypothetical protein
MLRNEPAGRFAHVFTRRKRIEELLDQLGPAMQVTSQTEGKLWH